MSIAEKLPLSFGARLMKNDDEVQKLIRKYFVEGWDKIGMARCSGAVSQVEAVAKVTTDMNMKAGEMWHSNSSSPERARQENKQAAAMYLASNILYSNKI